MAEKKKSTKKGTAFAGVVSGVRLPKGTSYEKNADGTLRIVAPKKKSK